VKSCGLAQLTTFSSGPGLGGKYGWPQQKPEGEGRPTGERLIEERRSNAATVEPLLAPISDWKAGLKKSRGSFYSILSQLHLDVDT
jgi:hypothetical protein